MDGLLNFAKNQVQQQLSGQGNQGQHGQQGGFNGQNQQQQGGFNNQQQQGGFNNQQQHEGGGFAGNQQQGGFSGGQQGGGGFNPNPGSAFDFNSLLSGANAQGGNGNQLQGMLSAAMGHIQSNVSPNSSVDEKSAEQAHNQAYNQGNVGGLDAQSMGAAAAIQAFKSFAQGTGGAGQEGNQQSMISKLIGMALAEASKLFNKAGGAQGGSEQDVLNSAGSTVMKLLVQNQVQGALSGQGGAAGAGQLMSLASKFLAK